MNALLQPLRVLLGIAVVTLLFGPGFQLSTAHAQVTAFSYQGRLIENGSPANGSFDFRFKLFNDDIDGDQYGDQLTFQDVSVSNGVFTVTLDFGDQFGYKPRARWLEIAVRHGTGGGAYQTLTPRQPILSAPYSLYAAAATEVTGQVLASSLSGKVYDWVLSDNVALLDRDLQTFTGATNSFNGRVGIGTSSPSREFEVQNTGDTEVGIKSRDSGGHLWTIQSGRVTGNVNTDASFQIIDRTLNLSRILIGTNGFVGIGTTTPANRLHVNGGVSATAFVNTSDRNAKENFRPVSPQQVLAKVTALPITTWNFKDMRDGTHMGPMAQDFYAAFGLGSGDTTITSIDPDGVVLAAIQGLNQKLEEKETEIAELRRTVSELKELVDKLAER